MKTLREILSEVTKRTTVAKSGRSELQRLMQRARKNPGDKTILRQVNLALKAEKLRALRAKNQKIEPESKPEVKSVKEPELQMNSDIKRAMMSKIENRFKSDASSHFDKHGTDILQKIDIKDKTANQITNAVADASYKHFHDSFSKKDPKPSISLAPIKSLK